MPLFRNPFQWRGRGNPFVLLTSHHFSGGEAQLAGLASKRHIGFDNPDASTGFGARSRFDEGFAEKETMMTRDEAVQPLQPDVFASLGGDRIAYLRPVRSEEVHAIFPQAPDLAPGLELWALLAANGQPIMLTDSKAAAIASAQQNDLQTLSVH